MLDIIKPDNDGLYNRIAREKADVVKEISEIFNNVKYVAVFVFTPWLLL